MQYRLSPLRSGRPPKHLERLHPPANGRHRPCVGHCYAIAHASGRHRTGSRENPSLRDGVPGRGNAAGSRGARAALRHHVSQVRVVSAEAGGSPSQERPPHASQTSRISDFRAEPIQREAAGPRQSQSRPGCRPRRRSGPGGRPASGRRLRNGEDVSARAEASAVDPTVSTELCGTGQG